MGDTYTVPCPHGVWAGHCTECRREIDPEPDSQREQALQTVLCLSIDHYDTIRAGADLIDQWRVAADGSMTLEEIRAFAAVVDAVNRARHQKLEAIRRLQQPNVTHREPACPPNPGEPWRGQ